MSLKTVLAEAAEVARGKGSHFFDVIDGINMKLADIATAEQALVEKAQERNEILQQISNNLTGVLEIIDTASDEECKNLSDFLRVWADVIEQAADDDEERE